MAARNNEMALKITGLTTGNMESTAMVIKLQEELSVKQGEMKKLQIQALDHLVLLQNRAQALMNQTYELHEYPIPRLFVVLPQETSSWNPKDFVSNKFRLYFLCECGDHTRQATSKIPHHIHLAKHEGYEITRPKEFFRQYGNYVLTILKMLKFGVTVAGVAIPAMTLLVRTEALDKASSSLKMLIGNLQTGMEQTIRGIEKSTADNGEPDSGTPRQIAHTEALEGADLRKLETFLKNKDSNKVLGNLYRTITSEGHVKWVCIDHYRENYHEKTSKTFLDTVESMGGLFDENIGRVKVNIRSKLQADRFYQALETAKSIYELEIGLNWDTTYSDFKKLRDCLVKSNVGALHINLHRQDVPTSDFLNRGKRHDPVLEIMRHPTTHSVSIVGAPDDFIKRSSLLSRNDDFSNLRILEIDPVDFQKEIAGLKTVISKMSSLTKLILNDAEDMVNHVCSVCGTTESFQGSIEVDDERAKANVRSRVQTELVYEMLGSSKSFHGLPVDLQVDLRGPPTGDVPERTRRYDSILEILQYTSTQSVVFLGDPMDFIQHSKFTSTTDEYPNLKNLDIDISASRRDISHLKKMISRMPSLASVTLNDSKDRGVHICDVCHVMAPTERSFELNDDRVKIHLSSGTQAELVSYMLASTESISGFGIDLCVDMDDDSTSNISDRIRGHDAVFEIMRHPSVDTIIIKKAPKDLIQQSSLLSRHEDVFNVKHLEIDFPSTKEDISGLKCLVSKAPTLSSLTFHGDIADSLLVELYTAVAEYQTYPITFAIRSLVIPPLTTTRQALPVDQHLSHLRSLIGIPTDEPVLDASASMNQQ
ncbi:hypothetical protein B0O80DRAFT_442223 [Mortierella sp. GBAus27b]|nr:hypothetical protein B0O80DRAFT_442223 [Mortierella sp. GBAus27b]